MSTATARRLSDAQLETIIRALCAARETYAADARSAALAGEPRIARAFEQQAVDADELGNFLQDAAAVVVIP